MGNRQNRGEARQQVVLGPRPLTPLQKWSASERTHEDMLILMQTSESLEEWSSAVGSFLRAISQRERYQNYVLLLLEYLKSENAARKSREVDRQELFTLYSGRLRNSYFTSGEFYEAHIDCSKSSAEKLCYLFEYYSQNVQSFKLAVLYNYPSIFTQFGLFVNELLENEIIITDVQHFSRFIISREQLEQFKLHFETNSQYYLSTEREKMLKEVEMVESIKQIYQSVVESFLKYDYADMAAVVLGNLVRKGYVLRDEEMESYLKVELYCLFLYELGKLSLSFAEVGAMTVTQILHYFFTHEGVEFTPELMRCFGVLGQEEKGIEYVFGYVFSPLSHLSVLVRLLEHKYVRFEGSVQQFDRLVDKIRVCRSEIGKYSQFLCGLVDNFNIGEESVIKYVKLVKSIQTLHLFNINTENEPLYSILNCDLSQQTSVNKLVLLRQQSVRLIRQLVCNYHINSDVRNRKVVIDDQQFKMSSKEGLISFLHFFKSYLFGNLLSGQDFHQIIFKELIRLEEFETVEFLLREEIMRTYDIVYEPIEMLVMDRIIELVTFNRVRKVEGSLLLLLNIIKLSPSSKEIGHYILAYYHYYRYLEERDVYLETALKQDIRIEHFYRIIGDYPNKIDSIDFNYLFGLQSCIGWHCTKGCFVPIVTDQYLKFKIYLCNKAFSLKKAKLANEIVQQLIRYEPPWISTELVKICRENPNCDEQFLMIAFTYCARGEDLEYILNLYDRNRSKNNAGSLSLANIRNLGKLMQEEANYLVLSEELVVNQREYLNLVAELAYNEEEQFRSKHELFFKLMGVEPERSFWYAMNYDMPVPFVVNFVEEGVRKGIINGANVLPYLIKYLFFRIDKELRSGYLYVKYKQYKASSLQEILKWEVAEWKRREDVNRYALEHFIRMVGNYNCKLILTEEFLSLYVSDELKYRFLFQEKYRKDKLVELRDQPMTKANAFVLKRLCQAMSIDIIDLSVYNLYSKANLSEEVDNEGWTIVQKLIYWGECKEVAYSVVQKLSQKIVSLKLLVSIYEYIRESEQVYRGIITADHLQIIRSLAAVQGRNDLYGVIPDSFFEREIGVYPEKGRVLSATHLRIVREFGSIRNIFVLSKALYFIYGCNDEIEKMVLSEFSLQQEDSEQFEMLRKRIKLQL